MTQPLNLFGVTPSVIASRVNDLTIDATSSPNADTVEEMIDEAAAAFYQECERQGFDPSALFDDPDNRLIRAQYLACRRAVIYHVVELILTARDRGNPEAGKYYREKYAEELKNLRMHPQTIDPREAGTDAADYPARPRYASEQITPLTIPGKIIYGGM